MADAFTPTLNLIKPEIDGSADTWGQKLNSNMDALDTFASEVTTFMDDFTDSVWAVLNAFMPDGAIIAWSGLQANIPATWLLCDGASGTPNMTDKFILGTNYLSKPIGQTGGSFTASGTATSAGAHAHTGLVVSTGLTEAQMPAHFHTGTTDEGGEHDHSLSMLVMGPYNGVNNDATPGMSGSLRAVVTTPNGKHTHGFSTSWKGGSEGHSHGIYSDGAHTHPVSMNATPPYYALAFLVRRIPVETAEEGGS